MNYKDWIIKQALNKGIERAANTIVIRGDEVLLEERISSGMRGWSIPGGHIEDGEQPAQAAARELYEETGINVDVGKEITAISTVSSSGNTVICHIFKVEVPDFTSSKKVDEESGHPMKWVPLSDVKKLEPKTWILQQLIPYL